MPAPPTFAELALELCVLIFLGLDFRSLVTCRQVSQCFKDIIDGSVALRYKLALSAADMEDRPGNVLIIRKRLRRLRRYVSAWRDLRFRPIIQLPPIPGGVFHWRLSGCVLARMGPVTSAGTRDIFFNKLPGYFRKIRHMQWYIADIGCDAVDFAIDPAQNLLILIELRDEFVKIYVKTMSSCRDHPAAASPLLQFLSPLGRAKMSPIDHPILILGNHLGILMHAYAPGSTESESHLVIWDWKTSEVVMWLYAPDESLESFAFLGEHYVLLGARVDHSPTLMVYDMSSSLTTKTMFRHVECATTFRYPASNQEVGWIRLHSQPGLDWSPGALVKPPFGPAQSDGLLAVDIHFFEDGIPGYTFAHLIPCHVLLSRMQPGVAWDWHQWAPSGTCMHDDFGLITGPLPCGGYRYVRRSNSPDWCDGDIEIQLCDFSRYQRHLRLTTADEEDGENYMERVHSAKWPTGQGMQKLQTVLQYTSKAITLRAAQTGIIGDIETVACLSEDNLVVVQPSHDGNDVQFHLLTL
ncbi:hypothetical protein OE88DRAFT_1726351 [Heliocybe sulcata]|uniref:Uncharacterized protein n=1 Tax=Heliocybe sulcata TaxID=5364 RepID=A0A5C3N0A0_9AGAM|nr:hypothetical protein OE88DRAFT_1726351 [Heliocybe sulcata]